MLSTEQFILMIVDFPKAYFCVFAKVGVQEYQFRLTCHALFRCSAAGDLSDGWKSSSAGADRNLATALWNFAANAPTVLRSRTLFLSAGMSDTMRRRMDEKPETAFTQTEKTSIIEALLDGFDRHLLGEPVVILDKVERLGLRIESAVDETALDRFSQVWNECLELESPASVCSFADPEPEDSGMLDDDDDLRHLVILLKERLVPILVNEVVPLLKTAIEKNDAVLSRVVAPSRSQQEPDLCVLTEKQREVFDKIDAIPGSSADARRKVQPLLRRLVGDKATEALVRRAADLLRNRGWGVRCPCGAEARYMWQRNPKCAEGGLLVLSHQTGGKHHVHASTTTFPDYDLIRKPDRRRRSARD